MKEGPLSDMQVLAQDVAVDVMKRNPSVDAAFVFCLRKADDSMGAGLNAPDNLPIDIIIGCVVQLLGQIREKTFVAIKKQLKALE